MSEINLNKIASCGVACFACPSYIKGRCNGCRSEDKQRRKSKLGCKVRICSLTEKKVTFCSECEEFPCKLVTKKLQTAHDGDKRYDYRWEIEENLQIIGDLGLEEGIKKLEERWRCPDCGGWIQFYHYICADCGKEFLGNMPKRKEAV